MTNRQPTPDMCPPHEWRLSVVRIDGATYDHHECARCGAQKDVPNQVAGWVSTWRRRGDAKEATA